MPNRILKESIVTSCEIDQLAPQEEVFFYRLLVVCDDFGRQDARPSVLRAKCFPLRLDRVKDKDVQKWLQSLATVGLVELYTVEGKQYVQVAKWHKHQQRRAKHSKFPGPEDVVPEHESSCNHMHANVPEESRNRGIEESESGIQSQSCSDSVEAVLAYWEQLREHYHLSKKKRTDTRRGHIRARLREGYTVDELKAALANAAADPFMQGNNPHGSEYVDPVNMLQNPEKVEKWRDKGTGNGQCRPGDIDYEAAQRRGEGLLGGDDVD